MTRFRAPVSKGLHIDVLDDQADMLPTDDADVPADDQIDDDQVDNAPAIDRDAGVIYGVSAMQAVEALGHGVMVDDVTLQQVADIGNAAKFGIKSRFTHPGMCEDGMGSMIGRVKNFRVMGDKVVGDLHLSESSQSSPRGDLWKYTLDLAEEDPSAFGMSVVVDQQLAWKLDDGSEVIGDRPEAITDDTVLPFLRVSKLHAVDVVDEPAANRDGLFAAAFAATSNADAAESFAQLDAIRERFHLSLDQARAFLDRYFAARSPKPSEPQEIPMRLSLAAFTALLLAHAEIAAELTAFANDPANADADEAVYSAKITELKSAATVRDLAKAKADLAAEQAKLVTELAAHEATKAKLAAFTALKPGHKDPGGEDLQALEAARPKSFTKAELAAGKIPEALKLSGNYTIVDG